MQEHLLNLGLAWLAGKSHVPTKCVFTVRAMLFCVDDCWYGWTATWLHCELTRFVKSRADYMNSPTCKMQWIKFQTEYCTNRKTWIKKIFLYIVKLSVLWGELTNVLAIFLLARCYPKNSVWRHHLSEWDQKGVEAVLALFLSDSLHQALKCL